MLPPVITVKEFTRSNGQKGYIAQFIGPRDVPWRGPVRDSEEQARSEWSQEYFRLAKRFGWKS